ncbi:MAG TPA: GNAT family N-acetyltransferase [Firmicutes bacterium]|nr:GNAT family N-acetyltransferase [Bacillota bacterium]
MVAFRLARASDLPAIVALLADDPLGSRRERTDPAAFPAYAAAFREIEADPGSELLVAVRGEEVVGCLQITYIPGLTYGGSRRGQLEGVRVAAAERGKGIGSALVEYAAGRARERGCLLLQLTTDKRRPDALRFYEKLGFAATHEGCKRRLRD